MKCLCSLAFCHSNSFPGSLQSASGVPATILKAWKKTACGEGRGEHVETTMWCWGLKKGRKTPETAAHFQINRQTV